MNLPVELKYTKSHEWVLMCGQTTARIGLTDYAQNALGSIVFVNLPSIGDDVEAGVGFGDVESVKAVSEVLSPLTGTVSLINDDVLDSPDMINSKPYESWLIEVSGITGSEDFLDSEAYRALCGEG